MSDDFFPEAEVCSSREFRVLRGLRSRVLVTLGALVAWPSLTLLYLAFWAPQFTLFQSFAILVVSLLAMFAVVAGAWISFGVRRFGRWFD